VTRDPVVALDCRWLGLGGAGRVTENLLEGLAEASEEGGVTWRFWDGRTTGPDAPEKTRSVPTRLRGQADVARQPGGCDLVLYMHQLRPLVPRRNVTLIHDTIPLLCASSRGALLARRAFYRRVARSSARIVTVSSWSRQQIVESLGVPWSRVLVAPPPGVDRLTRSIGSARQAALVDDYLLYVGAIQPHKNLPRLITAFGRTDFARTGGRLVVVGGMPSDIASIRAGMHPAALGGVELRPPCADTELVRLYGGCRAVVQPSLWEGFGLPAREALAAGIPVIGSTGGALAEVADLFAARFDPLDIDDMAAAIDSGLRSATTESSAAVHERARSLRERTGSPGSFARTIRDACLSVAA